MLRAQEQGQSLEKETLQQSKGDKSTLILHSRSENCTVLMQQVLSVSKKVPALKCTQRMTVKSTHLKDIPTGHFFEKLTEPGVI